MGGGSVRIVRKIRHLVLGGGSGQLALLRRLKGLDRHVVLQDRNPRCSGRSWADDFVRADTTDGEAAERSARDYRVDAVLTAGTDQPVLAAARAAAARGCPALLDVETARAVTDKEAMKARLAAAGLPTPRCRFGGPGGDAWDRHPLRGLEPPYVVKPVDSQGQRGVVRFRDPDAFEAYRDAALEWSRRGRWIVEEYHENREVTVSGWVHGGRVETWAVTDRVTRDFAPHIGLCLAHRYPSTYAAGRQSEIEKLTGRCVQALGIRSGPIYFQFLNTESGILVNETAARLGGAYEDVSLPPVCGRDVLGLLIAAAERGAADPLDRDFRIPVSAGAFAVPLMFCRPGRISSLGPERRVRAVPGITEFAYLQAPGTVIESPRNSVQRAAYMVVHGADIAEVNRILRRAVARTALYDRTGRQLLRNTLGYMRNYEAT